jgi:hypothetical protein
VTDVERVRDLDARIVRQKRAIERFNGDRNAILGRLREARREGREELVTERHRNYLFATQSWLGAKEKLADLKARRKKAHRQARKVFQRVGEPSHEVAERFAYRFNLNITDGWRPQNVTFGSPTSFHKQGLAHDFFPKRWGLWGVLDRAKAWAWARLRSKTVEVLWRVAGHNVGDNPHLHVAWSALVVSPSTKTY